MIAFWSKAFVSGLLVTLAATIARRQPALGSLIVSLPLVSVLSMIWLWRDGADNHALAAYINGTFWYFLPSMPMFLIVPTAAARTGFLARARHWLRDDDPALSGADRHCRATWLQDLRP